MNGQDELYERAAGEFGAALARLAAGYEADRDKRSDLLQEIHLALWRSFEGFNAQCSLRTWVYRVAHNVAATWSGGVCTGRVAVFLGIGWLNQRAARALDRQIEELDASADSNAEPV